MHLHMNGCTGVSDFSVIERLEDLHAFSIADNPHIENVDFLADDPWLESILIDNCCNISNLDALATLPRLRELNLRYLPSLKNVGFIEAIPALENLRCFQDGELTERIRAQCPRVKVTAAE